MLAANSTPAMTQCHHPTYAQENFNLMLISIMALNSADGIQVPLFFIYPPALISTLYDGMFKDLFNEDLVIPKPAFMGVSALS